LAAACVPIRVERLDAQRFRSAGRDADDVVHREHLRGATAPRIGHHLVLGAALCEKNRLRDLRKQIHDGRAPDAQRARRESRLDHTAPFPALELTNEEDDLRLFAVARRPHRVEHGEVEEEELRREREILLQQPVAEEGPLGIGKDSVLLAEADGLERRRRKRQRSLSGAGLAHDDRRAVVAQQLVEREGDRRVTSNVQSQ
jgi:hypothetical protein